MDSLSKSTTPKRSTVGSLAKLMQTAGGSPQKAGRVLYEDSKVKLIKYDQSEALSAQIPGEMGLHAVKDKAVAEHLSNLYEDRALCDLTLNVGSIKFDIHKVILSRCSDKYLNAFTGPDADKQSNDIALPEDVSLESVKEVIKFMYTGKIVLTKENVADVLTISAQLGIQKLIERCVELVKQCGERQIMPYLELGNKLQLDSVKRHMIDLAAKNFEAASQTAEFLKLNLDDLLSILRSRITQDTSEAVTYAAILNWLKAVPERTQFAPQILKEIQLDKIDPRHIQLIDTNPDVGHLPEIKKMLLDAYKYHAMTLASVADKGAGRLTKAKRISSSATLFRMPALVSVGGHTLPDASTNGQLKGAFCKLDVGAKSKHWDFLPNMPVQRSFHCAVYASGRIFVLGGCDTSEWDGHTLEPTNTVCCYHLARGMWTEMAPMAEKRMLFAAVHFSGVIYAIGGIGQQNKALSSVECYDPHINVWSEFPSLPLNCAGACACVHAESIVVIGGYLPTFSRILIMSTVFYFNFGSYRWESKTPLLSKSFFAAAVEANEVLYVVGGATNGEKDGELTSLPEIYEYNDDAKEWSFAGNLKTPRHCAGAAAIGSVIYVVGGLNYDRMSPLSTVETFNVHTARFADSSTFNLPYQLLGSAFCLTGDCSGG